eukprot:g4703.t1
MFFILFVVFLVQQVVFGLDNGVGLTPPMGWSSWQMFNRFVTSDNIRDAIYGMRDLKDAGYEYINYDGSWQSKTRDPVTHRQQMSENNTLGIKALADLAHSFGLKFGLYTAVGNVTCQGNPGSWGFEEIDAKAYAEYGIDYLKIDSCGGIPAEFNKVDGQRIGFEKMRDALNATGRPIFINTCGIYGVSAEKMANKTSACTIPGVGGGAYTNDVDGWREDSHLVANSWLVEWANNLNSFFQAPCGRGWLTILDANQDLTNPEWSHSKGFADMDIISVGCSTAEAKRGKTHTDCNNGNQTLLEQRSQFNLWCMKSAPLILGGDIRPGMLDPDVKKIITNKEMIALDQDRLVHPAEVVFQGGTMEEDDDDFLYEEKKDRKYLEIRSCNDFDKFQNWKILQKNNETFSIQNLGNQKCLSSIFDDPISTSLCENDKVATFTKIINQDEKSQFQLKFSSKKSLSSGLNGKCIDVNHSIGPDIDAYDCHAATHKDFSHQLFSFDRKKMRIEHSGKCLGLYSSNAPLRTLTIFTKKLADPKSPRAIALFNRGPTSTVMILKRKHLLLSDGDCSQLSLRDLDEHKFVAKNLKGFGNLFQIEIEVVGLKGRADLNGMKGMIVGYDREKGRYSVRLEKSGDMFSLKRVNAVANYDIFESTKNV